METIMCAADKPKAIGERKLRFVLSDETITRGFIVRAKGWDLSIYKDNPIVIFAHDGDTVVVGKGDKVWVDETKSQLMLDIEFLPEGMYDVADLLYDVYASGFMRGVSPGFKVDPDSIDYPDRSDGSDGPMAIYNKQTLLEVSLCAIPANRNALVTNKYVDESIESGLVTKKEVEVLLSWIPNMIGDENIDNSKDNIIVDLECEVEALKLQLKEEANEEDDIYKMIWNSYVGYDEYKKEDVYDDIIKEYVG